MAVRMRHPDEIKVRIEHFFWFMLACYLALVARLVYLQVIHGEFFRDKAKRMRAQYIPLPADRGEIKDRNGEPVAITVHRSQIVADPTRVKDAVKTAKTLADVLGTREDQVQSFVQLGRKVKNGKDD